MAHLNALGIQIDSVIVDHNMRYVAETTESLSLLLAELRKRGYAVRISQHHGLYRKAYWARFRVGVCKDIAICKTCKKIIDRYKIYVHKNRCPNCGAYTYIGIQEGNEVRFLFKPVEHNPRQTFLPRLRMKVIEYDNDESLLLLVPEPVGGNGLNDLTCEQAKEYLTANRKLYSFRKIKGKKVLVVKWRIHQPNGTAESDAIEMGHIEGPKIRNVDEFVWFKRQLFGNDSQLPMPRSFMIFLK